MKWSTRDDSGGREGNEWRRRMEKNGKERKGKKRKDKIWIGNKGMER